MKYLVANQKSLMTKEEIVDFIVNYKKVSSAKLKTIIIPSAPFITLFEEPVGLQNISSLSGKAYTGEIDIKQAISLKVEYVLVGHSERRTYSGESESLIEKKLQLLKENNLIAILCIGESLDEYNNSEKETVLLNQISNSVKLMNDTPIIAYEPVWAIGTGLTPTNEEIKKTVIYIKEQAKSLFNKEAIVLYGGSVSPDNINELETIVEVDGYLVGGASNDYNKWNKLVTALEVKHD